MVTFILIDPSRYCVGLKPLCRYFFSRILIWIRHANFQWTVQPAERIENIVEGRGFSRTRKPKSMRQGNLCSMIWRITGTVLSNLNATQQSWPRTCTFARYVKRRGMVSARLKHFFPVIRRWEVLLVADSRECTQQITAQSRQLLKCVTVFISYPLSCDGTFWQVASITSW